ncbi:MAG TPA: hypothetical protein VLY24_17635 [Bryobacteraceae bacterium]|nr:hypothetical protein [Bryobacteraceae bacterium]
MISDRLKTRLTTVEAILTMIDRRRAETGLSSLGSAMERRILDAEMADLEKTTAIQEYLEYAAIRSIGTARTGEQ